MLAIDSCTSANLMDHITSCLCKRPLREKYVAVYLVA